MGTEFADYNGDGRLDLVVTNHEFETHSLFRNDGKGSFSDASVEAGIASPTLPFVGFGVAFFDADNDGYPISRSSMGMSSTTPPSSGPDRHTPSDGCCFTGRTGAGLPR